MQLIISVIATALASTSWIQINNHMHCAVCEALAECNWKLRPTTKIRMRVGPLPLGAGAVPPGAYCQTSLCRLVKRPRAAFLIKYIALCGPPAQNQLKLNLGGPCNWKSRPINADHDAIGAQRIAEFRLYRGQVRNFPMAPWISCRLRASAYLFLALIEA